MSIEVLADAEVDVCGSCGGMWVDWFDGEVKRVATEVLRGEAARASRSSAPASSVRNEAFATGACPRCSRQLAVERYVVKAEIGGAAQGSARTSASQTTGADLLRCEECAGVFVPRTSAGLLATLPADEEAPPSETEEAVVVEPLPWRRFVSLLRRLVGVTD
jgi:Zn-finger nucleic acid-binding protein